ncbi:putative outer membrane protein [Arcticibacter svalbardensis MN12-7]|uniref:Putative outer membrane protein n=1 Tax=Arcticibacter svalbardensis MN12-7 TaxID=1150600 RepID=R9GPZ4_9SPHI|nr:RagB/SusD family nutrient uptake outer membrane protein [Arcticibacter svalbardensis]EOR93912.1 putative outer membrane protein [Arcticibacter svalbardensis MN12-7]
MKTLNKYLNITFLTILLSGLFLSSCQEYLDQDPQSVVSEAVYYKNATQFTNASNNFYTRLGFDYDGDQHTQGDAGSDLSNNLSVTPVYGGGLTAIPTTDAIWTKNYSNLRAVNQLIEKAAIYPGNQTEIAVPLATAYFFRAWHHYNLLRRFGGVPIVTKSLDVNSEEVYAKRNSRYEVVSQILKDLDMAIAGLPTASTLGLTGQGKLSITAAQSFKARVLLYEATWDKYVATTTDGDGVTSGVGSAKPADYPSVTSMLTEAKSLSLAVISGTYFYLWDHRSDIVQGGTTDYSHLFYLYNLEDAGSNPKGLTKADNHEFIFQTVYDFTLRQIRKNLSHSHPVGPSRKLMDMYLCTDGLPVQHSAVFQGYSSMISEFTNRDLRLTSFVNIPLQQYWGYGSATTGGGAQYSKTFATAGTGYDYRYIPVLTSPTGGRGVGYMGNKFVTEYKLREDLTESFNYPQIRLAEVMLIYAESTCELGNGSISDADLNLSINKIRARSGVASLTNALIAPFPDMNMLGEIRRERAIELDGEGFRFDDLKRWNIAPQELNKNVCSCYIAGTEYATVLNPKTGTPIYLASGFSNGLTTSEQSVSSYSGIATTKAGALILDPAGNRNFTIKNYLDPIPSDQITLNPNLKQNPIW